MGSYCGGDEQKIQDETCVCWELPVGRKFSDVLLSERFSYNEIRRFIFRVFFTLENHWMVPLLLFLVLFLSEAGTDFPYIPVRFSVERGFYDKPISVLLQPPKSFPQEGTTIRYTTSKDLTTSQTNFPSQTAGTLYATGTPISISATTILRAIAFNGNLISNLTTSTYIFTADVIRQTKMLQSIVNDPRWSSEIQKSLQLIPSISFSSKNVYPVETDRVKRPRDSSLEWLNPMNPKENWHQVSITFDIYGGLSRTYTKKKPQNSSQRISGTRRSRFPFF